MSRDIRIVNMTSGQQIESDEVLLRMGETAYRNEGSLARMALFDVGKALITSGLRVVASTGLTVSIPKGDIFQRDGAIVTACAQVSDILVTMEAATGVSRTDIIEAQIIETANKTDYARVGSIATGGSGGSVVITNEEIKRDVKYELSARRRTNTTTATAATAGALVGTVAIAGTIDLQDDYLINISDGEDGNWLEIDCSGTVPNATTRAEIIAKINAALGRTAASASAGDTITITGASTGKASYFSIKPPVTDPDADGLEVIFGASAGGLYQYEYRGVANWVKIAEIDMGAATTTITNSLIRNIEQKDTWASGEADVIVSSPIFNPLSQRIEQINYARSDFQKVKSDANRTILCLAEKLGVIIDDNPYVLKTTTKTEINVNTAASWDDIVATDWTDPANRAGKDFYIYACIPLAGNRPDILLSANSTFPDGYTADNSRKIGGFHCLCVSAGTTVYGYENEGKDADYLENMFSDGSTIANGDTNHWLKNFVQGDILPLSCWDLIHRPNENADVEGKVYDPKTNLWVDIYLPSWNAGLAKLLSVYGGAIADGASTPLFHWYRFSQVFTNQGQRLPRQDHFVACSLGSPQGVEISTGVDPITTGGKVATNTLRIISNIGVEDACGVLWQWGSESGHDTATAYTDAFDANDKNVAGQEYSKITRPIFGGSWGNGVKCGSRGSIWNRVGLDLVSNSSGRGFAEPK